MVISTRHMGRTFVSGLLLVVAINIAFQLVLSWRQFDQLVRAEPWLITLAIANQLIAYAVIVPALGLFYERSGISLTKWRLFAMASSALAIARVLPGGDYAVWRLSLQRVRGAVAATTQWYVLYVLFTVVALGVMFALFEGVVLYTLPIDGSMQVLNNLRYMPVLAALVLMLLLFAWRVPVIKSWIIKVALEKMPKRKLTPIGIIRERKLGLRGVGLLALAVSVNWLVEGYTFALCLAAVGIHMPLVLAFAAFGFARLVSNIPVSPGGVGAMEASAVLFLGVYGLGAEAVLTATLIYRLITYWPPLMIGGIAYLLAGHHGDDKLLKLREGLSAQAIHRRLWRRRSLSVK